MQNMLQWAQKLWELLAVPVRVPTKRCRQSKLDEMTGFRTKISKSASDKLKNSLTKCIALDCRPLSVVEDRGVRKCATDSDEEALRKRALSLYRAESTISETDCTPQFDQSSSDPPTAVCPGPQVFDLSATSVPCRRLFLLTGHKGSKKSCSENVNMLVCLSNWLNETDSK